MYRDRLGTNVDSRSHSNPALLPEPPKSSSSSSSSSSSLSSAFIILDKTNGTKPSSVQSFDTYIVQSKYTDYKSKMMLHNLVKFIEEQPDEQLHTITGWKSFFKWYDPIFKFYEIKVEDYPVEEFVCCFPNLFELNGGFICLK